MNVIVMYYKDTPIKSLKIKMFKTFKNGRNGK